MWTIIEKSTLGSVNKLEKSSTLSNVDTYWKVHTYCCNNPKKEKADKVRKFTLSSATKESSSFKCDKLYKSHSPKNSLYLDFYKS
jgi:hypothetical protein